MTRRRLGWAALGLVGMAVLLLAKPLRVAVQTLLLLPALFPAAPLSPLGPLTAAPERSEFRYDYANGTGTVEADLYRPAGGGGPYGGIVLLLGALPVPKRDPFLVSFAEALARSGVVVLVPESSNLVAGRVVPEERDALRKHFELLRARPDVDPRRVGFVGFSVGAALSLIAASEPELRDQVRFVNVLGGYFDAARLLREVGGRSLEVDGRLVPWEPDPRTLYVLAASLLPILPQETDRALLTREFLAGEAVNAADVAPLTPLARDLRELLRGTSPARAAAIVGGFEPRVQQRLAAISPSASVGDVRAPTFVMHDRGDRLIPFTQSRALVASLGPDVLERYTELNIFQHVIPDRPVPWQTFLPDLWALFWHLHAVLMRVL